MGCFVACFSVHVRGSEYMPLLGSNDPNSILLGVTDIETWSKYLILFNFLSARSRLVYIFSLNIYPPLSVKEFEPSYFNQRGFGNNTRNSWWLVCWEYLKVNISAPSDVKVTLTVGRFFSFFFFGKRTDMRLYGKHQRRRFLFLFFTVYQHMALFSQRGWYEAQLRMQKFCFPKFAQSLS